MSKFQRLLLIWAVMLLGTIAFADSLNVVNPTFSIPTIACSSGYAYQGTGACTGGLVPEQNFNSASGFGWVLGASGDGLTVGGTAFQSPSFGGLPFSQAVFLQSSGSEVSQVIGGFTAGQNYTLSFYLGSRFASGAFDGNQTVEALLDGTVIGTWALSSFTPFTLESVNFTAASSGNNTLEFLGTSSGDHTAFLSDVAISTTTAPVPEPSSLALLGTGLLGLAGYVRRRLV